jgi:hypothetical protein
MRRQYIAIYVVYELERCAGAFLSIHAVSARTATVARDGCYPLPYGFAYLANFCVCFVANSLTVLTCTAREYHSSQTSNFIQIRKPFSDTTF